MRYILNRKSVAAKRIFQLLIVQMLFVTVVFAQTPKITLNLNAVSLSTAIAQVQEQSKMKVFYNNNNIDLTKKVSVQVQNVTLQEALDKMLKPYGLTYNIVDNTIVISPQPQQTTAAIGKQRQKIDGYVFSSDGQPIIGANIFDKNLSSVGAITNEKGFFTIGASSSSTTLIISFVGKITQEVPVAGRTQLRVVMQNDNVDIDDVIVNGYIPKAKNSFTGTAVQVKGDDLRKVNPTNFMDAIKVFDPSFQMVSERELFGADPNRIPDAIQIRGASGLPDISEGELKSYTNLPIFIMDGFQIDVQQVFDLDVNRVQSVTILKDAAAASIYGSRAANGVVVIETKSPEQGKLRVTYTFNGTVEAPDLSSYNLMNAKELLEYLRLSGVFGTPNNMTLDNAYTYQMLLGEVNNGVNSYWMSQPLQVAFKHEHSLFLEGGSRGNEFKKTGVRYQVNLLAAPGNGVMKGSSRSRYNAGLKLFFNSGSNFQLMSDIQIGSISSVESPYGSFGRYTSMFPFYRMKNSADEYYKLLSTTNIPRANGLPSPSNSSLVSQYSPMYDALYTDSYNRGETTNINYNLGLNWSIMDNLRVKGTFSITNTTDNSQIYKSPLSSEYFNVSNVDQASGAGYDIDNIYKRGRHTMNNVDRTDYSGNLTVSYTKEFGNNMIQSIVGGELSQSMLQSDGYITSGFLDGMAGFPSAGLEFLPNSRPTGSDDTKRTAGAFMNVNYSYDSRYLFDLTGRVDGSSNFASEQRTAPFWSAGARWNIYNEKFMKNMNIFENLAIRANIGTTGNQNFQLSHIKTLYKYHTSLYDGNMGAEIISLENPNLRWQVTLNRNIGVEFSMLKGFMNFDFNYYYNTTNDNLTDISIAPSIGFGSYKANMGKVENRGIEFSVSCTPVKTKDFRLNITANGANNRSKLVEISSSLRDYNKRIMDSQNSEANKYGSTGVSKAFLFEEGQSLNTIYAVRSLGIDPATGQEMFLTAKGDKTFIWNAADQVPVGVQEPKLRGFLGVNVDYKNWNFGTTFAYSIGGQKFNYTLFERIETPSLSVNADRRALYERWSESGQVAKYKAFGASGKTNASSRFVQDENFISMNSLRATYNFEKKFVNKFGLSMLKVSATANDLFYISTIEQERGLSYPFARKFFITLQANF